MLLDTVLAAHCHVAAFLKNNLRCCCWGLAGGSHAYTAVQTAESLQDDDIEQQQEQGGGVVLGTVGPSSGNGRVPTRSPMQQQLAVQPGGLRPADKGTIQSTATHYV